MGRGCVFGAGERCGCSKKGGTHFPSRERVIYQPKPPSDIHEYPKMKPGGAQVSDERCCDAAAGHGPQATAAAVRDRANPNNNTMACSRFIPITTIEAN